MICSFRTSMMDTFQLLISLLYNFYYMKRIKNIFLFLWKNFLTGFIIMLWALAALLWAQAFQSLTSNPSTSGNQSLGSPILSKNGGTFNRDVHSLEAIARFLWVGAATGYKRVFVTSTAYTGNLGWVTGADNICQTIANNQSLWGNWVALLSDNTSNFITRYTTDHTKFLYTNLLWQPIFTSWYPGFFQNIYYKKSIADFFTYNALTNESSVLVPNPYYWSSTNPDWISLSSHYCNNWSNATASYYWYYWFNYPNFSPDAVWNPTVATNFYYYTTAACNANYRLLCIEK